jgi:hypothetical protein
MIVKVIYNDTKKKIYIKLFNLGETAPLARFSLENSMSAITYAENLKKVLGEEVYIEYQGSIFNESGC